MVLWWYHLMQFRLLLLLLFHLCYWRHGHWSLHWGRLLRLSQHLNLLAQLVHVVHQ